MRHVLLESFVWEEANRVPFLSCEVSYDRDLSVYEHTLSWRERHGCSGVPTIGPSALGRSHNHNDQGELFDEQFSLHNDHQLFLKISLSAKRNTQLYVGYKTEPGTRYRYILYDYDRSCKAEHLLQQLFPAARQAQPRHV